MENDSLQTALATIGTFTEERLVLAAVTSSMAALTTTMAHNIIG